MYFERILFTACNTNSLTTAEGARACMAVVKLPLGCRDGVSQTAVQEGPLEFRK